MGQHAEEDRPWYAMVELTPEEQRRAVITGLVGAVPFLLYAWHKGGIGYVLASVIGGLTLGLIGRQMPIEMKRNHRIWLAYQIGVIIVGLIITVVVVF